MAFTLNAWRCPWPWQNMRPILHTKCLTGLKHRKLSSALSVVLEYIWLDRESTETPVIRQKMCVRLLQMKLTELKSGLSAKRALLMHDCLGFLPWNQHLLWSADSSGWPAQECYNSPLYAIQQDLKFSWANHLNCNTVTIHLSIVKNIQTPLSMIYHNILGDNDSYRHSQ